MAPSTIDSILGSLRIFNNLVGIGRKNGSELTRIGLNYQAHKFLKLWI